MSLVKTAIAKRNLLDGASYDAVWCVFDTETPPSPNLDEALALARSERLQVARSNPCFEIWLLMHFADQRGMLTNRQVEALADDCPGYRNKGVEFAKFDPTVSDAIVRAYELERLHQSDGRNCPDDNPSSSVAHLVASLLGYASAQKIR